MPPRENLRSGQGEPIFRIAHISDMHFGKISHPGVVGALVDEVNRGDFDVVVISGDITQRARESEFRPAREMLDAMRPPQVVVPGNHDVPPWWRPIDRVLDAGGPFRKYISQERMPRFCSERDGLELAVFGLDSSHGLSIAGGRIRTEHVDEMVRFFARRGSEAFQVLTVHHQLTQLRVLGPHDVARGARRTLRRAATAGVELLLCGHLHMSHVAHIELDVEAGRRLVIASAGTATSSRGRRHHRNINFYNSICVWHDRFAVEERRYDPETHTFARFRVSPFARALDAPAAAPAKQEAMG